MCSVAVTVFIGIGLAHTSIVRLLPAPSIPPASHRTTTGMAKLAPVLEPGDEHLMLMSHTASYGLHTIPSSSHNEGSAMQDRFALSP